MPTASTAGKPLARATINQALAAVTLAHRNAGYAFDRKHRVISMTWSGISRVKAMVEIERQAAPFLAADVRDLLAILKVERNIGCRNAALLTLGFGAALRRSELVGLDWQELGTGTGFVRIDERGILITLARSKATQDKAETVVIPRAGLPPGVRGPGGLGGARAAPAGRRDLPGGQQPPPDRGRAPHRPLASRASSSAPCATSPASGASPMDEAKELMRRFSGHSLRAGFVTSAAAVDVPALRIAQHIPATRAWRWSAATVREADKYCRSALKGIFAPATETQP